jgi:TRAP-type C4-dicarboxylate transport system permease small subunit
MTRFIKKMDDTLALLEKSVIIFCFLALVCFVLFDILSRNFFHLPALRIIETAPGLVLWIALLGASHALKQGRHIRLELLLRYASGRFRYGSARVTNLFGAAVMTVLLLTSFGFVRNEIAMFGIWGGTAVIFPIFFASAGFRYLAASLFPSETPPTIDRQSTPDR